ncbi:hypothetical protein H5300_22005 [Vibrio sp. SG41-7]|uniref:hypothetical protein n=1 Tax=Vibrio sp. SG41-7 TaxID=2760973 RepID=UPI001600AC28|nr:hypothetical protein [Vibrio sp. SG41-7]MBB1465937.1 hypothetical protein [Vibrio sp. SG41-7]
MPHSKETSVQTHVLKSEHLQSLTRWKKNKSGNSNSNSNSNLKKQHKALAHKIEQALSDYSSGQFKFKKDVAKKHNISTPTLLRHAKINECEFVKKTS